MKFLNSRRDSYEELLPASPRRTCLQSDVWRLVTKSVAVATLCFVGVILVAQLSRSGSRINKGNNVLGRGSPISDDEILVTLDQGKIEGKELESRDGRKYLAFLGIPYAKPPIGDLRFLPPEKLDEPKGKARRKASGTLDATEFKSQCMQLHTNKETGNVSVVGSEDCLYLNIYTPKAVNELGRRRNRFPVIFYVHGGIHNGNASQYGADYFMDEDVVLVMVHFRLNVFGHLNTGDSVARGNFAVKDQVMALRWVQENIGKFGGDRQRVTIYGTSYGAMLVSTHLLSPMSKGLFHRAIMQSGTLMKIRNMNTGRGEAEKLAKILNCSTNSSIEMFDCFRQTPGEVLTMATTDLNFAITIEPESENPELDTALPDEPLKLLKAGKFNAVPSIHGITSSESLSTAMNYLLSVNQSSCGKVSEAKKNQLIAELMDFEYAQNPEAIAQALRDYYFTPYVLPKDYLLRNLTNLISDREWVHPMSVYVRGQLAARRQRGREIFLYYFSKEMESSLSTPYIEQWSESSLPFGPAHADDLQLFFPNKKFPVITKESQYYNLSKSVVRMWANFAKTANPTYGEEIEWTSLQKSDDTVPFNWFEINDEPRMFEPFGVHDRIRLWDSFNITDLYI